MFHGEHFELLDGLLIVSVPEYWIVNLVERTVEVCRDPEVEPDAEYGAIYRNIAVLEPPAAVTPLGAPPARVAVADLLPPAS